MLSVTCLCPRLRRLKLRSRYQRVLLREHDISQTRHCDPIYRVLLLLPPFKKHLRLTVNRYVNLSLIVRVARSTTRLLNCHCIVAHILLRGEGLRVLEDAPIPWLPPQRGLFILSQREVLQLGNALGCGWVLANRDRVKHQVPR